MKPTVILVSVVAVMLSGCGTIGQVNASMLQSGKPIGMWTGKCEGYVVQSGLPVPLGQRMEELDALCPGKRAASVP